jgi:hypothetical protein
MTDWMRLFRRRGSIALPAAWMLALLLGLAAPSFAHQQEPQGGGQEAAEEDEDTGPKISFHAFFNQAYAVSDGYQVFGIPERGTTDYRNVALQVRYEITPRDIVVTQLSNERLGRSTINEVRDDVELDWAFYERRLTDATTGKVGKMQLPFGFYNEVRDVGTLLPFYAPPFNFYLENYTSESVEGLMLSHSFARGSSWSVDADLYYGGWDRIEQDTFTGRVVTARVENGVGTQLWLNTPVPDLRFGLSAMRFDVEGRLNQARETDTFEVYALSGAATFGRVQLHAEGFWSQAPFRLTPEIVLPHIVYLTYYGQIGLELTPKWSLNWQSDFAEVQFKSGLPDVALNEDHALGLVYRFRYNVVAKAEVHHNKGFLAENELSFVPLKTRYGILSWSVSF